MTGDPQAETESRDASGERPAGGLLDVIGLLTGVASLAAAILVYMGWAYMDAYLSRFYLRALDLEFGFMEYALRGLSLFTTTLVTSAVVVVLLLAVFTKRAALTRLLPKMIRASTARMVTRLRLAENANRMVQISGVLLLVCGLGLTWLASRTPVNTYLILVLLGLGPLVVTWSIRREPAGRIGFVLGIVTASVCSLWAASLYAHDTGEATAENVQSQLARARTASVYATERLALNAPGLTRVDLPGSKYKYRYDGLRLLMSRGGRYYLIPVLSPGDWHRGYGRTFVINEGEDIRVELLPGIRSP